MFSAIIYEPASPNPRASKAPILIIVCSRMTVSYGPSFLPFFFFPFFFFCCFACSKARASSSSAWAASRGFLAILFTFYIIASIGAMTSSLESRLNSKAPAARMKQTKNVLQIPSPELNLVFLLRSKTDTYSSESVTVTISISLDRRSAGDVSEWNHFSFFALH